MDLFFHHNSLGSVVAVTDAAGTVKESYRYSAFGQPTIFNAAGSEIASSAVKQPYMFTGARWDEESSLYQMRLRYYDPVAGRFVSRDPLGMWGDPSQAGNGQGYCGHDPVNGVDPMGLEDNFTAGADYTYSEKGKSYTFKQRGTSADLASWAADLATLGGAPFGAWLSALVADKDTIILEDPTSAYVGNAGGGQAGAAYLDNTYTDNAIVLPKEFFDSNGKLRSIADLLQSFPGDVGEEKVATVLQEAWHGWFDQVCPEGKMITQAPEEELSTYVHKMIVAFFRISRLVRTKGLGKTTPAEIWKLAVDGARNQVTDPANIALIQKNMGVDLETPPPFVTGKGPVPTLPPPKATPAPATATPPPPATTTPPPPNPGTGAPGGQR